MRSIGVGVGKEIRLSRFHQIGARLKAPPEQFVVVDESPIAHTFLKGKGLEGWRNLGFRIEIASGGSGCRFLPGWIQTVDIVGKSRIM